MRGSRADATACSHVHAALHVARLAALVVLLACSSAHAQSSGGVMGGEDWGSSSSSSDNSGGGRSDYASTSDYGSGNDDSSGHGYSSRSGYHSGGAGGCDGDSDPGGYIALAVLALLSVVVVRGLRNPGDTGAPSYDGDRTLTRDYNAFGLPHGYPDTDVTRIAVVLDARVRASVQGALAHIADSANTADADGRARMLGEVTLLLRRHRAMWLYGAATNYPLTSADKARVAFQLAVLNARATYRDETTSNVDGRITTSPSDAVARSEEGPGVILVSILVAARRELVTVMRPGDGESMRLALEALGGLTPSLLLAVKVVWTPSDPDDRMTSVEAEQILRSCDGAYAKIEGATVGVAVCAFCSQLYPAEAFACVHCGAPPTLRATRAS